MGAVTRRSALAAGAGLVLTTRAAQAAPGVAAPDDMSLGSDKAGIRVVEYASLSCGHCAAFNEQVFPALKAKYIDTGRIRYTIKEMLTSPVQVAMAGFLMARCAGPSKYFKVADEVFRSQSRWRTENVREILARIGAANGLSEAQFESCIADSAAQQALALRVKRAVEEDGVEGTPTFFVNGLMLRTAGGATLADFDAAIAAASRASGRR
jgi:protein-disulfide isomerase